mmetsp:Transcript_90139/g.135122  ORF Transcript_90139/g.135122 Transcript_90139/m.135122 type:complete len:117 (-) Transcript_90139:134-484(-)
MVEGSGGMPRKFKLLDELEKGEKTGNDPSISYGLDTTIEDPEWKTWNATILGPYGTSFNENLYELKIEPGMDYPNKPPIVRFISKINMGCVHSTNGLVDVSKLNSLKNWDKKNGSF